MFRGIANALNKRNKGFVLIGQDNREAEQALQDFLIDEFGNDILEFNISIESNRRINAFTVITSNKTIAMEINLRIESLRRHLVSKGLKPDKLNIK
ncbi:MAG: hypothetical protein UW46_C0002G0049 [Candidatus Yanofskybacteria bacterium GW2011_GWF1_44_227]|uniref:Uncharacterized protein n=1 Tax=Candidatus Yanofskybacteria bacterium GW2011_GWE2_40_11 TaxID=1619033 RepID=A0A0G0QTH9_9BACT|nr:MAG: hypothetical protein UT69_C0004G0023 [Candidatus Yanofskybacteria bacterium GW2011_GWE1_40_10]KKR40636.1 MAG: hypothetical protein UT75_C0006G0015 [Candidatus Yanofskybacteria bacterium GW2011_GWE2_40_11]KKT15803.1 MAG: hypothetical protein UV97_C0002G0049 [Candidatus Yanofskybacteria bacterium GW2011_GWF2_43_596]KKT53493.1 MAG: hypothetical protein UW46_C0002G0049 [Candidatus Yanofskybacteria bacterium GW2011_GWF1_44_227]OGN35898.1 MAG: hypothetical protein A2241_03930 [Candidatus Yano